MLSIISVKPINVCKVLFKLKKDYFINLTTFYSLMNELWEFEGSGRVLKLLLYPEGRMVFLYGEGLFLFDPVLSFRRKAHGMVST